MIKHYKKTFLKELVNIPKSTREKMEADVFNENYNLILSKCEKLKGYKDKFKIRYGDYRIGITINKKSNEIIFERVAHRKDIYKLFPSH